MEADSTTVDTSKCEDSKSNIIFPFPVSPRNFSLYKSFIFDNGIKSTEGQIVERLQSFGLLLATVKCPTSKSDCKVVSKTARVIDRVQWICEACGKKQPIRIGSFFFKMQCSIQQVLQMTLAWCEDIDLITAAKYFGLLQSLTGAVPLHCQAVVCKHYCVPVLRAITPAKLQSKVIDHLMTLGDERSTEPSTLCVVMGRHDAYHQAHDLLVSSLYLDIRPKVASSIYARLDELAIKELDKLKLGGGNDVVLAEMYPDCLNRLSPDTTDQPHVHRILMLADTKHIPTYYRLHVIRKDSMKLEIGSDEDQILKSEVETVLENMTDPQSMVVLGNSLPNIKGCTTYENLVRHCDVDMQHFLNTRIWRQALTLCAASRELCGDTSSVCAISVQRYLDTSLYRLRYGDGFYEHILRLVCAEFTDN